jgi:hypothetical protein
VRGKLKNLNKYKLRNPRGIREATRRRRVQLGRISDDHRYCWLRLSAPPTDLFPRRRGGPHRRRDRASPRPPAATRDARSRERQRVHNDTSTAARRQPLAPSDDINTRDRELDIFWRSAREQTREHRSTRRTTHIHALQQVPERNREPYAAGHGHACVLRFTCNGLLEPCRAGAPWQRRTLFSACSGRRTWYSQRVSDLGRVLRGTYPFLRRDRRRCRRASCGAT